MKKFIGEGLKNSGVNLNVLNVVRTLVEDTDAIVYVPNDYVRATKKLGSGDTRVHFYPVESGKPVRVISVKSNKERFNFSIVCTVDVMVEYPDGENIKLVPKKVFRTYNIIRDGELVITSLAASLSESSFNDLRDAGILYYNGVKVANNHEFNDGFIYRVDLSNIPIVSVNWAQPVQIGLYKMMSEDLDISAKLSVLKKMRSDFPNEDTNIDDNDIYIENYSAGEYSTDNLGREVECMTYSLVGYNPTYSKSDFSFDSRKDLEDYIRELNRKQNYDRFMSRCIIFAISKTKKQGSFEWTDVEPVPRSKDKYRQFADVEVNGNVIKIERRFYKKLV